jgi:VWFA-related protein
MAVFSLIASLRHTLSQRGSRKQALTVLSVLLLLSVIAQATLSQNKKSPAQPASPEAPAGEQDEVVKLRSDLVVLSVTVTDEAGKYAHKLKAKDFNIVEDGVAQTVNSFSAEEAPFAAAILVDMSGSMSFKFGLVRAAAASFIEAIRDDDQVAVYGFNNKVKLFQDFSNVRDINDNIWDAEAQESTKLYDCMNEALEALAKRPEKRRAVLVISDGCDNMSQKANLEGVIKKALIVGANIYCIDLIDSSDLNGSSDVAMALRRGRTEMQRMAEQSGARYINSPQGDKLNEAFNDIIEELRNQYTLTFYSSNQKRDGRYRKLTITTSNPKLSVRSRRGYFATKS